MDEDYKANWNKNAIIEFQNEHIALIQRKWGNQIEFIEAFDSLTKQGFVLRANESYSGKFSGRNITYFYFQKAK